MRKHGLSILWYLYTLRIALRYYYRRLPKHFFFILTTQRTGSTLLVQYLNSTEIISVHNELLNPLYRYGFKLHCLPWIRRESAIKKKALFHIACVLNDTEHELCGTKLMKDQLEANHITIEDLHEYFPSAKFIILYRKSLADQYVSLLTTRTIGAFTRSVNEYNESEFIRQLVINPQDLLKYYEEIRSFYLNILAYRGIIENAIIIEYEELAKNPNGVFADRIFPFFNLLRVRISTNLAKQITQSLFKSVKNFDGVKNLISGPISEQKYTL